MEQSTSNTAPFILNKSNTVYKKIGLQKKRGV
jgi:hypothetical protein